MYIGPRMGELLLEPATTTAELDSDVTFDCVGITNSADSGSYLWNILDLDGRVIPVAPEQRDGGEISSVTYSNVQFFDPGDTSTFVSVQVFFDFDGPSAPQSDALLIVVGEKCVMCVCITYKHIIVLL